MAYVTKRMKSELTSKDEATGFLSRHSKGMSKEEVEKYVDEVVEYYGNTVALSNDEWVELGKFFKGYKVFTILPLQLWVATLALRRSQRVNKVVG